MKTRQLHQLRKRLKTLRTLAFICHPIGITLIAFLMLFTFSYLTILPLNYKLIVLGMVACFTVLIPLAGIFFYSHTLHLPPFRLEHRSKRTIIYLLTLFPYAACLLLLHQLHMPDIMIGILLSASATLALCTLTNFYWKINIHMAGLGLLISLIIALSHLFYINPVVWLSLIILLTGISGTCSILCRVHTLSQVLAGIAVGLSGGLLVLLFL